MERLLNGDDRESVKMAMLKHEETFRNQVNELHRLYRIQKMLMKDVAQQQQIPDATPKRSRGEFAAGEKRGLPKVEDDENENELELTLGPKSYYQKKIIKAGSHHDEPNGGGAIPPAGLRHGLVSSHVGLRRTGNSAADDQFLNQQKWWGLQMPESNQERLDHNHNNPHRHFQLLSLNMA